MTPPRYSANPRVIETDLRSELILLDPETQEMFSLNETGRAIWRALPLSGPEEAVRVLTEAFEVAPDDAMTDASALLSELVRAGLVRSAQ